MDVTHRGAAVAGFFNVNNKTPNRNKAARMFQHRRAKSQIPRPFPIMLITKTIQVN
jgi:hypothetical protein